MVATRVPATPKAPCPGGRELDNRARKTAAPSTGFYAGEPIRGTVRE
jgi:hypothetical protein